MKHFFSGHNLVIIARCWKLKAFDRISWWI